MLLNHVLSLTWISTEGEENVKYTRLLSIANNWQKILQKILPIFINQVFILLNYGALLSSINFI